MMKEVEKKTDQSCLRSLLPSLKENFKTKVDKMMDEMDKDEWLKDMRGNLSMVTTLISAITFQAALNPPGGVVQTSTGLEKTPIGCNSTVGVPVVGVLADEVCTGEAVMAVVYSDDYLYFLRFNAFSFVASLTAALFLVSGIPLRHRFLMWFLSIAMSASLTSLAITYLYGVLLVTPAHIHRPAVNSFKIFMWIWIGGLGLVTLFLIITFLHWFKEKKPQDTLASEEGKRTSSVP